MDIELKYGCNPHQKAARVSVPGNPAPFRILNGEPSYINILDALTAWQLVRELRDATGKAGAASFKHVSPAGAAVAGPLTEAFLRAQMVADDDFSPAATAYLRARGGDRMSSFGDAVAVSEPVDVSLADVLKREVSDLIIAPAYEPAALDILKAKQKGRYRILQMDPDYEPPEIESRDVFGFRLQQHRNTAKISPETFTETVPSGQELPKNVLETLTVGTVALKYTQSNSVCLAYDGQVIGMGAGQQSRIHCTRLAAEKAEKWFVRQHPQTLDLRFRPGLSRVAKTNVIEQYLLWDELSQAEEDDMASNLAELPKPIGHGRREQWLHNFDGICLCSDACIPFRDNIDRAGESNVQYVAQPGGSLRDEEVTTAARRRGMTMIHTHLRCFLH